MCRCVDLCVAVVGVCVDRCIDVFSRSCMVVNWLCTCIDVKIWSSVYVFGCDSVFSGSVVLCGQSTVSFVGCSFVFASDFG